MLGVGADLSLGGRVNRLNNHLNFFESPLNLELGLSLKKGDQNF